MHRDPRFLPFVFTGHGTLMSLAGLARTRRGRWIGVSAGMAAGGMMGVYQMLKGAHFPSHTVVTAFVCWIVFLTLRRVFVADGKGPPIQSTR